MKIIFLSIKGVKMEVSPIIESYLPVFIIISLAVVLGAILSFLGIIIGPKRKSAVKLSVYESGVEPVGNAKNRVSVKYYLVAMLFIIFDIEVVFMYPWAVSFREMGIAGFLPMLTFVILLFAGYYYVLRKGGLKWD
ncbi:MAG: NADH-quinone oxidoreductase subunit A [Chloroherpetonaceae bacterium]|nr:NADH-quinone oxidoreductase subunit A [Chloroherpetonaceae bacterium]